MDRMEATEESLVMRGSRRSLPQYSQYHLETEHPLHNQESLRHRAPRQASAVLQSPPGPVHTSTPQAAADWRNNFPDRSSLDRSGTSSLGDYSLQGDSGYGGLDRSRDRDSGMPRSSSYPGKERKGWWGSLQKRLWGRPSFLETGSGVRWSKLEPQQILVFLVLCILLACAGFSFLIVYKHLEGLTAFSNGKYRSLQYRHGSGVTEEQVEEAEVKSEEQVEEAEVKSEEQELPLDQPWQLSEAVLEDFYDVPQDNVEEDVIDTKSLEANVPEVNTFGEKETNNDHDQIQKSIEESEILNLKRELEKKKHELVAKLETMGLKQKKLMERPVLSEGIVKEGDQEKETQDVVKVAGESLVTKEQKPIKAKLILDSKELKEVTKMNNDEIKKDLKIKRRKSRIVNPLMKKKTLIKLGKAGRMKRDL